MILFNRQFCRQGGAVIRYRAMLVQRGSDQLGRNTLFPVLPSLYDTIRMIRNYYSSYVMNHSLMGSSQAHIAHTSHLLLTQVPTP